MIVLTESGINKWLEFGTDARAGYVVLDGIVQCDSKLLSGFPLPIIFKQRKKIKLLTEVISHFSVLILQALKLFELHFHIHSQFYFVFFRFEK
jgi:hypothetical protein